MKKCPMRCPRERTVSICHDAATNLGKEHSAMRRQISRAMSKSMDNEFTIMNSPKRCVLMTIYKVLITTVRPCTFATLMSDWLQGKSWIQKKSINFYEKCHQCGRSCCTLQTVKAYKTNKADKICQCYQRS